MESSASTSASIPRGGRTAFPTTPAPLPSMEDLLGITYPQGCYNELLDLPSRPFAALFTYEVDPNERMDADVVPQSSSATGSSSSLLSTESPSSDGFLVSSFQEALKRDLPSWALEVRDSSRSGLPHHVKIYSPHLVGRSGAVALCVALIKLEWLQRLFGLRLTRLTLQVTTTDLDIHHLISLCQSYVIFEDCIWRLLVHGSADVRCLGRHSRTLSTATQPLRKVCRLLARAANMDDYSNSSFRHLTHLFEDPKKHGGGGAGAGTGGRRSPRSAAAAAAALRQRGGRAARSMAQGTAESRPFLFEITHLLPKEPDGPTWVEFHTVPSRSDFLTVQPWLTFVICFVHGACKLQSSQVGDLVELFSRKLKPLQPLTNPKKGGHRGGSRSAWGAEDMDDPHRMGSGSGANTTRTTATSTPGDAASTPFSWAGFGAGDDDENSDHYDDEDSHDGGAGAGAGAGAGRGNKQHRGEVGNNSNTLNEASALLALQFYVLFDLVLDFPALYRCCYETHCPEDVQMLLPAVLPSQELRLGMNLPNVASPSPSSPPTIPVVSSSTPYLATPTPQYYSLASIARARPPLAGGKPKRRPQTAGPAAGSKAQPPRIPIIQATLRRDRPVSALHHRGEGNPLLAGGGSLLLAYEPLLSAPFTASTLGASPHVHDDDDDDRDDDEEEWIGHDHLNDEGDSGGGARPLQDSDRNFEVMEAEILGKPPLAQAFGEEKMKKHNRGSQPSKKLMPSLQRSSRTSGDSGGGSSGRSHSGSRSRPTATSVTAQRARIR